MADKNINIDKKTVDGEIESTDSNIRYAAYAARLRVRQTLIRLCMISNLT